MAAIVARSATVARPTAGLKRSAKPAVAPVSTATATQMMVWQPINNKQFETFSYLPPLTSDQIGKQVDYIVNNGWTPCLEFADQKTAYASNENTVRFSGVSATYYDNRYWTMWKLPMFGCTDSGAVLAEVARCGKAFPTAYIRLVAFDADRQVQVMGFLVQRPRAAADYCDVSRRSVA